MRLNEMATEDLPRTLRTVADGIAELPVKTYRWLTLVAALLITLCEVLVFNSQSARGPEARAGVATDVGSGRQTRRSPAGAASIYWSAAASDGKSPRRVR
jgi:hypothetical protein